MVAWAIRNTMHTMVIFFGDVFLRSGRVMSFTCWLFYALWVCCTLTCPISESRPFYRVLLRAWNGLGALCSASSAILGGRRCDASFCYRLLWVSIVNIVVLSCSHVWHCIGSLSLFFLHDKCTFRGDSRKKSQKNWNHKPILDDDLMVFIGTYNWILDNDLMSIYIRKDATWLQRWCLYM
jgi:hypothetical protein